MSESRRQRKVNEEIKRAVSIIILHDYGDTPVGHVVITAVRVSPDIKNAKIYFRTLTEDGKAYVSKKLREERKNIRHKLASHIKHMRFIPELFFVYDDGIDKINRIDELLRQEKKSGEF